MVDIDTDSGPNDTCIPELPAGWTAQWESHRREYYFVQLSSGVSTWIKPTTQAPGVVTFSQTSTPVPSEPYTPPPPYDYIMADGDQSRGFGKDAASFLNSMTSKSGNGGSGNLLNKFASGIMPGSNSGSNPQKSNFGQMASNLLGGQGNTHGSGGHGSGGGGGGGITGIVGNMMSGHRPSEYGYRNNGRTGPYNEPAPSKMPYMSPRDLRYAIDKNLFPEYTTYNSNAHGPNAGYGQNTSAYNQPQQQPYNPYPDPSQQHHGAYPQHQAYAPPGQQHHDPNQGQNQGYGHQQGGDQYGHNINQYGQPPQPYNSTPLSPPQPHYEGAPGAYGGYNNPPQQSPHAYPGNGPNPNYQGNGYGHGNWN